jgi:Ca-activated chloride channel family protein
MRGRILIIGLAFVAVVIAFATRGGTDRPRTDRATSGDSGAASVPSGDRLRVSFVYSPEKEKLIRPLVARFNAEHHRSGGSVVQVDGRVVASGEAEEQIAAQRLKPVLWSPASSLWGRQLNYSADRRYAPQANPSLVRTPLVIAMWEPMARALGWPRQRVGFREVLRLAESPKGWAAAGRPTFGKFKLGHTNPDFSTSGLSAVAAEYYAAASKREGLTVADVDRPAVRRQIRAIERSIVHYGPTTLFFSDQLRRYGTAYASAVAMEEVTLLEFNRGRRGTKLVALYPSEGTFFSDNPLIVLGAPWVSPPEAGAARTFIAWLRGHVTPQVAARSGFRSGDAGVRPPSPITSANGADPSQPSRVLSLPEPAVLDRIRRAWREDRKPATIMLVIDTSGSMVDEDKLPRAQRGLRAFLDQLSPSDRVGLTQFSSDVRVLSPIAAFGPARPKLLRQVRDLVASGNTALFDATQRAIDDVRRVGDESRINAVVLLTDGRDTNSRTSSQDIIEPLRAHSESEGVTVRVFTIAYGSTANGSLLDTIATASGGKNFPGDPTQIESVYKTIASFF